MKDHQHSPSPSRHLTSLALLGACAFLASPLSADLTGTEAAIILNDPLVRTGIGAGTQTIGYTFTLDTPRTLTHLGMFSYNGTDGGSAPRQVGVWDSAGTLVAEVTIPAVSGAEIEDFGGGRKFLYMPLDASVILLPEEEYTAGVWYSVDNSPGLAFDVGFTTIEGFNFGASANSGAPGGAFEKPAKREDFPNSFIGPNLRFDPSIPVVPVDSFLKSIVHDSGTDMLEITWESQAGKLYDLLSSTDPSLDPETWPVVAGAVDLVAEPPVNTVTIPRPADDTRLYVVREKNAPPPPPVFCDDFESIQNWTVGANGGDGGNTVWERGAPVDYLSDAGQPPLGGANNSANCFGTNLGADYGPNTNICLRSPVIDLTAEGLTGASLTLYQYLDTEFMTGSDVGSIRVLRAGDLTQLGADLATDLNGIPTNNTDWQDETYPLPAAALGEMIVIEFQFVTDGDLEQYSGWYIDDVKVEVE